MSEVEQFTLHCLLCGALKAGRFVPGERALGTQLVAHVDRDVIVLVGPTAWDLRIAPRRHLVSLSTTSDDAAPVLFAMRVVVNALRSALGVAGATIEPTLEIGGVGHVTFRVVPTAPCPRGQALQPDVESVASLVSGALDAALRTSLLP
ncbi:MAG TPA: hypothetical protein VMD28_10300 [Acidimicrobiales bacterium]|nr:hypothetical protein [Acidimicrobiales bacterium]